jgi:methylglyoxal synthase
MGLEKTIALVAHDNKKQNLADWARFNANTLIKHNIVCTGTTGKLIEEVLKKESPNINVTKLKSGPLGGDQQLGALIIEGKIDIFIFFWDPMQPHPHDVDVKALLRISVLYNVPTACNRSSADFVISSKLFNENYKPLMDGFDEYINRNLDAF